MPDVISASTPCACVRVFAPCRLHFGMFCLRPAAMSDGLPARQYGGVGLMVRGCGGQEGGAGCEVHVRVTRSERLAAVGDLPERSLAFARQLAQAAGMSAAASRIDVRAPRQHTGLGVGTALGLSIAAALCRLHGISMRSDELAKAVGRGRRSAVGVHGFFRGGLIVEAGKRCAEELSPLAARAVLPESWRFVLFCPEAGEGLAGHDEAQAFEALPPTPPERTCQLHREVLTELLPAAHAGDFSAFARSLHRFGELAGSLFAPRQHGAYATPAVADAVRRLRFAGLPCVVQSSWGPTLAVPLPNDAAAEELCGQLPTLLASPPTWVRIAQADGQGFQLSVE